jgi:hypothetical protein
MDARERGCITTAWFKVATGGRTGVICSCCSCCCVGIEGMRIASPEKVLFVIEVSVNFWQKLSYILTQKEFTVLLINPMTTKYERRRISRNFSRTDPRDALLVANAARQGYYHIYRTFHPETEALHRLAITYDKLKKQLE